MPETPNFDQLARSLMAGNPQYPGPNAEMITDALREVWNARGAADIAKLDNVLSERGVTAPLVWLVPALRNLDR